MKAHQKKKYVRLGWKRMAQHGMINDADGKWINRSGAKDNSMRRDYHPQSS